MTRGAAAGGAGGILSRLEFGVAGSEAGELDVPAVGCGVLYPEEYLHGVVAFPLPACGTY